MVGVTPNRKTRVVFDVAETVTVSPFQGYRRRAEEIVQDFSSGKIDEAKLQNIMLWPTGAITLKMIQTEISNIQEYTIGLTHVVGPDNPTLVEYWSLIPSMVIENQTRQNTDLVGLTGAYGGDIATVGSPFIVRKISAGGSWDEQLPSGVPSMLSGSGATPPPVPVDRVGESVATYPEDQGFFLNWTNPGHDLTYPGVYMGFYFGQYAVAFTGSGYAILYEQVQSALDGSMDWVHRSVWRYARTGQISGTAHSMAIWPHLGPSGQRYICFTNSQVDFAQVTSSYAKTTATSSAPGVNIYEAKPDARYMDRSPGHVTMAAQMRFDIRRDWKMPLQVSTLGWPTSGFLVDEPGCLAPDSSGLEASLLPLRIFADTVALSGTGISSTLVDDKNGGDYDLQNPLSRPVARFDFVGDGKSTPILWGYNVNRDSLPGVCAPGEFTGGNLKSVSITGYSGDPTQMSAHVVIEDLKADLPRLRNRGQFRARIDVEHIENGQTFVTPVFQGYAFRPTGRKRGKPGSTYPSPDWTHFEIGMQGMWMRLSEPTSGPLLQTLFYNDPSIADDQRGGQSFIPWKVTDAIRYLIGCAGFSPNQINIPDLPIRLWPGFSDKVDERAINPNTDYAEMALRLCRNFLGGYLCYDESVDQWTLLSGTPLDAAPLYRFYTTPPEASSSGQPKIPTAPGAYGPNATFITEMETETIPAEFNVLHVACPVLQNGGGYKVVERWLYNHNGYAVPGSGVVPSPDHPDYIGHMRPFEVVDCSLYVEAGPDSERLTQLAVDWTARRLFDFCCHGQRLAHFTAPLEFILDPATGVYRMPRFVDPITINDQPYQIKSPVLNFDFGGLQMLNITAIQPVAGQYIPPGIEHLEFLRKATDKRSGKAAGSYTQSNRLGNLGVPPHAEHRIRDMPRLTNFQYPLQDPATGLFYEMAGYDPAGIGLAP